ncbi:tripartite tricarboxylate transporter TctB family protein [Ornithinimicrobium cavernae]|uniref:tripartite tricarboxylate transporter TctB family protein n=1 Tax=Ornithinimicrobium cavernae TaxID=2666047 RepID=UPI000D68F887|nr:tripartite tricarboxylate transporter TctB family protein [Ornithinimicrobium cavernae]
MSVPTSDLDPDNALDTTDPEASGQLGWQLVLPLGFLVVGTMILVASTQFPDTAAAVTAPGLYPGIVSVVLIVASLLSIGELFAVRRRRTEPAAPVTAVTDEERRDSRRTWARAVTVTVLSALYVVVTPYAGFVVTTFLYCFAISLLLRDRSVRGVVGAALIAGGLVAAAYYGFAVGLHAPLPKGVLF